MVTSDMEKNKADKGRGGTHGAGILKQERRVPFEQRPEGDERTSSWSSGEELPGREMPVWRPGEGKSLSCSRISKKASWLEWDEGEGAPSEMRLGRRPKSLGFYPQ